MRSRILPMAMIAVSAALLLSSCTFSLTPQVRTVKADDVANTAEKQLEKQVGTRPDIDCGKDDIALKAKSSITCLLTDPSNGLEYNVVITFSKVTATDYTIKFKVADTPNNQPTPTVGPSDGGTPSVPGDDIAALVVTALSPGLGFPPDVSCPEPQVQIVVDNKTYCQFTDDSGSHDVEVTITSFDPDAGQYTINAKVLN